MQASEIRLRQLIEGTKQYLVPLFQRPYSWSEKHWKTLWDDVLDQSKHGDGRPHFFGSIVTAQAKSVPQGVFKHLLIDGQQRMTTTQVFLAALRDTAGIIGDEKLCSRIDDQYLVNQHEEGDERLKVLATQVGGDRPAFRAIIQRQLPIPEGRLANCYRFFRDRLDGRSAEELHGIHTAIVDRLSLVGITCDDNDNPHLIFESLNAKGEKLTPADLIRNFLLMRVHVNDQERLYRLHWLPVQEALGDDLTEFVRHYLMKGGKILKESEVYLELKDQLASSTAADAESFLADLSRHGQFYARFVDPKREADRAISDRLDRVRRLKVTVAYPFLLRVFDAYQSNNLTHQQVIDTLDVLESFVMRRSICGLPTNQRRRMLPPVFEKAGGAGPGFVEGVRRSLGGRHCPDDEAFVRQLTSVELYSTSEKNARLRIILEQIERSFGHHELVDLSTATIEHVMPQTLTPNWERELGEGAIEQHAQWLHTLGNLTLTGYNSEIGNQGFAEKREAFSDSNFQLNRYFSDIGRWTSDAIRQRAANLADRALRIWPDVGRDPDETVARRVPGQALIAVRFRGATYPVGTWKDGFNKLLALFDSAKPGLLLTLAAESKFQAFVSADREKFFSRANAKIGEVYVNNHASAAQLQAWCRRVAKIAGIAESEYAFVGGQ